MSESESAFRLQTSHLACTWSALPVTVTPSIACQALKRSIVNFDGCVVVHELHQDGGHHLHGYIRLSRRTFFSDPLFADLVVDGVSYHGKYKGCAARMKEDGAGGGGVAGWVRYIMKEKPTGDDVCALDLDYDAILARKGAGFAAVAGRILEGATQDDIMDEHPGFLLQHGFKIDDFAARVADRRRLEELPGWPTGRFEVKVTPDSGDDEAGAALQAALNYVSDPRTAGRRRHNIWIAGETGVGKSHMCLGLARWCDVVFAPSVPAGDNFICGYTDKTDVVVFDDFDGAYPLAWLNSFISATTAVNRKRKSLHQPSLDHSPLVIVTSQERCDALYPHSRPTQRDALHARFRTHVFFHSPFQVYLRPAEDSDSE